MCFLRADPQAAAQVAMASAMIQACLVLALCGALASTCQGAMVYGSTLRESPSIGLGGNLSDVARLQKDQVCKVLAVFCALRCRQRLTESCVIDLVLIEYTRCKGCCGVDWQYNLSCCHTCGLRLAWPAS